jgi:hypothetical protein
VEPKLFFFSSGSDFHKVSAPALALAPEPAPATAGTSERNFFAEKLNVFL